MSISLAEESAMRRAIALSAFGLGSTSPNPAVGCVILDTSGGIVGQGYHKRKGEAHAEVNALSAAGERARGGTAVVTLEPCNHYGRTPPCHQALLDAAIARVLIGVIDPTSRGEGGAARLRKAGIDVVEGVLADEVELVLGPWLTTLRSGRPRVLWTYQIRHDGSIQPANDEQLPYTVDVAVNDDGTVIEVVSGSHGDGMTSLAGVNLNEGPKRALAAIHNAGARSVVLHGGTALAEPFIELGLVDHIEVYVAHHAPSSCPIEHGPNLLPAGFQLCGATNYQDYVRLTASRMPDERGRTNTERPDQAGQQGYERP